MNSRSVREHPGRKRERWVWSILFVMYYTGQYGCSRHRRQDADKQCSDTLYVSDVHLIDSANMYTNGVLLV